MPPSITCPEVDAYFAKLKKWKDELLALRTIILSCPLTEAYKWYHPCYVVNKGNVLLLGGFKEYCMIAFVKGALLKDDKKILVQQTKNVQASRIVKFTAVPQIEALKPTLLAYIKEAVAIEKSGQKISYKTATEYAMPDELNIIFTQMPNVKTAFEALTPGRQKAYLLYFAEAKQSATRKARIEKFLPKILEGKGRND